MLYFKNAELTETYHVSLRTILNWIEAAKQGKLELSLHDHNGKSYVANTARNIAAIEKIVAERKKYRNSRGLKVVTPKPEFYKLYNKQQVIDIIFNLDVHHEIPRQYNYFGKGAEYWDKYIRRLSREKVSNGYSKTVELLEINRSYFDYLLVSRKRINIVDIGTGNAMQVRDFLQYILDKGKLGRYIGLDISERMLQIAQRNINTWFGNKVAFEGHQLDINYDRFGNLLANEYLEGVDKDTLNIILVLGGTLENLRSPNGAYRIIHDSMGRNDLLIVSHKLDVDAARKFFDFNFTPDIQALAPDNRLRFIIDLLDIADDIYDVEMGFDHNRRERFIQMRLKVALTIKFDLDDDQRSISFNKDDTILLWRYLHQTIPDITLKSDNNNFNLVQTSQTDDNEYSLTMSRIKLEDRKEQT